MMKHTKSKPAADPGLEAKIRELIRFKGGGYNENEVADVIENALKLLTDVKDTGDVRVIQTSLRELRYAFRLFAPYNGKRKVSIFGSARTKPDKVEYQQAVEFGRKITQAGYMVITGAGPGIMQAGHEGAGPENSFGANIRLPWEQGANPIIAEDDKLVTFKYFFTRKLTFIRHSDAIVLFPGGFGTLDEGYEAMTLMQTGKSQMMPLVLVDRPGGTYWKAWDQHIREHLQRAVDGVYRVESKISCRVFNTKGCVACAYNRVAGNVAEFGSDLLAILRGEGARVGEKCVFPSGGLSGVYCRGKGSGGLPQLLLAHLQHPHALRCGQSCKVLISHCQGALLLIRR